MYQATGTATELQQAAYIELCGERMADSIACEMLDIQGIYGKSGEAVKAKLKPGLIKLLNETLDEIEVAEWAARICGNMSFDEFLDEDAAA
jgi:hypothetical protein